MALAPQNSPFPPAKEENNSNSLMNRCMRALGTRFGGLEPPTRGIPNRGAGKSRAIDTKSENDMLFSEAFTSIPNARDLAETATSLRPGRVFRSGNPSSAIMEDYTKLRQHFRVQHLLDLRSAEEHALDDGWHAVLNNGTIKTYHFSDRLGVHTDTEAIEMLDEELPYCELHRFSLLEKRKFIPKLLWRLPKLKTLIALAWKTAGYDDKMKEILLPEVNALGLPLALQNNQPTLIFCKLGKDRTGLISALVLSCCDVDRSEILKDYALSNGLNEVALGGVENMKEVEGVDRSMFSSAPPEVLEKTFEFLDRKFGGVHEYLDHIGFSHHLQRQLKDILT
eukprot:jgi/Picre1/35146/NNA_002608.t1